MILNKFNPFPKSLIVQRSLNFVWTAVVVTLGAQLFTLPVVLFGFGQWYGIGLVSSVLLGVLFSCFIGYGLLLIPFLSMDLISPHLHVLSDYFYNRIVQICESMKDISFLRIQNKITDWQVVLLFICLIIFYRLKTNRKYVLVPIGIYLIIVILSVKYNETFAQ